MGRSASECGRAESCRAEACRTTAGRAIRAADRIRRPACRRLVEAQRLEAGVAMSEMWAGLIGATIVAMLAFLRDTFRGNRIENRADFAAVIGVLQHQIAELKVETQQLRTEHEGCRDENASLKARVLELETEVKELKAKAA